MSAQNVVGIHVNMSQSHCCWCTSVRTSTKMASISNISISPKSHHSHQTNDWQAVLRSVESRDKMYKLDDRCCRIFSTKDVIHRRTRPSHRLVSPAQIIVWSVNNSDRILVDTRSLDFWVDKDRWGSSFINHHHQTSQMLGRRVFTNYGSLSMTISIPVHDANPQS